MKVWNFGHLWLASLRENVFYGKRRQVTHTPYYTLHCQGQVELKIKRLPTANKLWLNYGWITYGVARQCMSNARQQFAHA